MAGHLRMRFWEPGIASLEDDPGSALRAVRDDDECKKD